MVCWRRREIAGRWEKVSWEVAMRWQRLFVLWVVELGAVMATCCRACYAVEL